MSDIIYTKSETGKKWHIEQSFMWTLCNRNCASWFVWIPVESPPGNDICQQCQAIAEALRTGEGMPF